MKRSCIGLLACAVGCALALQHPAAAKTKEKVLHSFGAGTDGSEPYHNLIDVNGTLYGTTYAGGAYGYGTVFALDSTKGTESVLHSFGSGKDGRNPIAGLTDVNGTLYGTTGAGGGTGCAGAGCGTLFSIDPTTGAETVLYRFCSRKNCTDGGQPYAGVINAKGTLYGTTYVGGAHGTGTVFALDLKTGAETVLHSFVGTDGSYPAGGLIEVKGILYGTASAGGAHGNGTVFVLDLKTDAVTVLYSFCSQHNCTDGADPRNVLIDANGTLYGTTSSGGVSNSGTVFSLDPITGTETLLYSFCSLLNCRDGAYPRDSLLEAKGSLYGTTYQGGTHNDGTVFALDPTTGVETVLYSFCRVQNCTDGAGPDAGLIDVKGTLYGTTSTGGTYSGGTVFALRNP